MLNVYLQSTRRVDLLRAVRSTVDTPVITDQPCPPRVLTQPTSQGHGQSPPVSHSSALLDVDERRQWTSSDARRGAAAAVERRRQSTETVVSADGGPSPRLDDDPPLRRQTSEPARQPAVEPVTDPGYDQQRTPTDTALDCKSASPASGDSAVNRASWAPVSRVKLTLQDDEVSVPLSVEQIERVELFYAGHATELLVCRCLACLYVTSTSVGTFLIARRHT